MYVLGIHLWWILDLFRRKMKVRSVRTWMKEQTSCLLAFLQQRVHSWCEPTLPYDVLNLHDYDRVVGNIKHSGLFHLVQGRGKSLSMYIWYVLTANITLVTLIALKCKDKTPPARVHRSRYLTMPNIAEWGWIFLPILIILIARFDLGLLHFNLFFLSRGTLWGRSRSYFSKLLHLFKR